MHIRSCLTRRGLCALLLLLWTPLLAQSTDAVVVTQRYEKSVRGTVDGFPFLLLRGDHGERGEAHGVLAAREILKSCDGMALFIAAHGGGWDKALTAVQRFEFSPRFETELAGMLRGIRKALPRSEDRVLSAAGREIGLDDLKVLQTGHIF